MKKIESLTPEQIARFPEFVERWTKIGLCTEPADRPKAERSIRSMYRAAKLEPPKKIVWCGSPMSQGLVRAIVLDERMIKEIGASVGDSVGDSVRASVRASVWASVWASVGASVWDSVRDSVRDSVWASVGASVRASVRASVWDSVRASVYGQHDANWLGFYAYFREALALKKSTAPLLGLTGLCESAGWAIPHAGICWVSERHSVLVRNAAGRLHCATGPAVMYPDGWAIYAVNGTRVPSEWIEKGADLEPELALNWPNVEQRRAAAELIGWSKILAKLDAKVIDQDRDPEVGELLEVNLPDAPNEKFLRVQCGTKRSFVLPVPREMRTALQANAWTYPGFTEEDIRNREART